MLIILSEMRSSVHLWRATTCFFPALFHSELLHFSYWFLTKQMFVFILVWLVTLEHHKNGHHKVFCVNCTSHTRRYTHTHTPSLVICFHHVKYTCTSLSLRAHSCLWPALVLVHWSASLRFWILTCVCVVVVCVIMIFPPGRWMLPDGMVRLELVRERLCQGRRVRLRFPAGPVTSRSGPGAWEPAAVSRPTVGVQVLLRSGFPSPTSWPVSSLLPKQAP